MPTRLTLGTSQVMERATEGKRRKALSVGNPNRHTPPCVTNSL